MLFTSLTYLLFLSLAAIILYLVPGRFQWIWLLVCSIAFYYSLLPLYLILFLVLVVLNYFLGIVIEKVGERNLPVFIASVSVNILVLAFFKYFGFFRSLFADIQNLADGDTIIRIILPVGLSFFIFTVLSYLIEIKRGTIKAERHVGVFATSLLFFPKIMQGPIEKPGDIIPQFKETKVPDYDKIIEGLKLIIWGLFKKLVVADRLAIYVNAVYDNYEHHSGISILLATVFYSFQIYADFSGYTDIALGSGKILGFSLTNNFRRPYFATSIKDFWSRWHISLSVWLRDYLFLPIAVGLTGVMKKRHYMGIAIEKWIFLVSSLITFTICGIWHGEGLNFLVWGLLFGFYLTVANWTLGINKKIRQRLKISKKSNTYKAYNIIITFSLVSIAWIFFRADTTKDAIDLIQRIFMVRGKLFFDYPTFLYGIPAIALLLYYDLRCEKHGEEHVMAGKRNWFGEQVKYALLTLIVILTGVLDGGQFIYFQF